MRRISIAIMLCCTLACFDQARGNSITLKLLGVDPTGTAELVAPTLLPAPYNTSSGGNFYAGVLRWSDNGTNTADYFTYCVDIASVIDFNIIYHFNSESPSAYTSFNSSVLNGIQNLWNLNHTTFQQTLAGSNTSGGFDQQAEELQIAIWDIIYNGRDGSLSATEGTTSAAPVYFKSDAFGLRNAALTMASAAFNAPSTGAPADMRILEQTDGGQSQLFLGFAPRIPIVPRAAPLPTTVLAGGLFFALLGGYQLVKRSQVPVPLFN